MIPISSKLINNQKIYDEKISKYGKCDNIVLVMYLIKREYF